MKITKAELKRIIKEEIEKIFEEPNEYNAAEDKTKERDIG